MSLTKPTATKGGHVGLGYYYYFCDIQHEGRHNSRWFLDGENNNERSLNVYSTGADLFGFGLSTRCGRGCSVRLQRRQRVEHDREIAGAGDVRLDNVVVGYESVWHTLSAEPSSNVVFIEWNNADQSYTKLGRSRSSRHSDLSNTVAPVVFIVDAYHVADLAWSVVSSLRMRLLRCRVWFGWLLPSIGTSVNCRRMVRTNKK